MRGDKVLAQTSLPWRWLWWRLSEEGVKWPSRHGPRLNPLGKYTLCLIFALQHSSGKPLTSVAMSTVLHKHCKFIIQTLYILSSLVLLFDKHSIYTVMSRTKKNLSGYFQEKKNNLTHRETHSALDLRIHLKIGILTQHHTQIGIPSLDRSCLWQELPAQGFPAESEQVWCNSGTLICGHHCCGAAVP